MALRILPSVSKIPSKLPDICAPSLLQSFSHHGSRYVSALAEMQRITAPRTSVKSPSLHTHNHLGLWYTVDPEEYKRLFGYGGFCKKYVNLCNTFTEACFMIREPALTVIDYIKRSNLAMPPNKFLLYGKNGTGKSMSLAHILHFMAEENWVLLHVWWAPLWRRSYREITPSLTTPECFDHPTNAAAWLQHFKAQNSKLINELQLTTKEVYQWSQRQVTEAGSPLMDIVNHGIARSRYATEAVMALTNELKTHATEGRCKVGVVVDGINSLYCPKSTFKYEGNPVAPQKFTLYKAFLQLLNNDWKNGCIVGSIDTLANNRSRRGSHLPYYVLGQMGWEALDPFVPVPVHSYNDHEMRSIIDYYVDREWLPTAGENLEEVRRELTALSNQNPRAIMEMCESL